MLRSPRWIRRVADLALLLIGVAALGGCANGSLPANGTILPEDLDLAGKRQAGYAKAYDPKGHPTGQKPAKTKTRKVQSGMSLPH